MEIKNDRQKLLLIVAGAVIALWLGDTLVFSPLGASWNARAQRIRELRTQVDNGETSIKYQRSYDGRWSHMRTNALPANTSLAEGLMLESFERWERASGIGRLSMKPQWHQNEDAYMTLECRADYTSDIDKLMRFLFEVEKDPLGLKVDSFEITSRDDNGRQLSLGLQISGLVLVPPPSATPTPLTMPPTASVASANAKP